MNEILEETVGEAFPQVSLGLKIAWVYKITSEIKPERCYVGSTGNINQRRSRHLKDLRRNIHPNAKLQNHYNKYGAGDLVFSILVVCPYVNVLDAEQHFIDFYSPWFNIAPTAYNSAGTKRTEETRRRISESSKGRVAWNKGLTKETSEIVKAYAIKNSISHKGEKHGNFGKHLSQETRDKISASNKGKVVSAETRQKTSESLKENIPWNKGKGGYHCAPISNEAREQISKAAKKRGISKECLEKMAIGRKGRKMSTEAKQKLSNAFKGRIISDEHRRKISAALTGKKVSDETRAKMSKARKGKVPWNKGKKKK